MSRENGSGLAGLFHVEEAAAKMQLALHAIQHRGEDASGLAVADGQGIACEKNLGLAAEALKEAGRLAGNSAVGHVANEMKGETGLENVQPIMVRAHQGAFAVVCCGTISNADELRQGMESDGLIFQGTSSAELIAHLVQLAPGHLHEKIAQAAQAVEGSYAFLLLTKNTMYAMRSRDGIQPLSLARLEGGYAFATENAAFSLLGAEDAREVAPGELIRLGKENELESWTDRISVPVGMCAMEYVYYARPDSTLEGHNVYQARQQAGARLAEKETMQADIVIGVPDTAMPAAAAFAAKVGLPYEIGLIKNRYIGSTFIRPSAEQREKGMRVRLNAISPVVRGRRVFLVDDSLEKGLTARRLSQLLKEAGAKEVHLRIASPRIVKACPWGRDDVEEAELAAAEYTDEQLCELLDLDSLRFLESEEFEQCVPAGCRACFGKG